MLDFDGFVVRRGAGHGGLNARPPEMRQASLLKNHLSVRRDSVKAFVMPEDQDGACVKENSENAALSGNLEEPSPVITFVFDANRAGNLTVFLMVTEVEQPLEAENKVEEKEETDKKKKGKGPVSIKLVPREASRQVSDSNEKGEDAFLLKDASDAVPVAFETQRIEKGLGQVYRSLPIDLSKYPVDQLCFDPNRPKNVPIAILLEADVEPDEPTSVQYSYITLQGSASSPRKNEDNSLARTQWSASLYSQKLQYGMQCFVLHEVFGVTSKISHEGEHENGNSDCVICLSEPRDTAVLPCRHMCFCSYCAGIVRRQCDRCPVCRQKVQSLLTFKRDQDGTMSRSLSLAEGACETAAPTMPQGTMSSTNESAPMASDLPA
jgi:hypothetical protein